jgi:hypothetical protein
MDYTNWQKEKESRAAIAAKYPSPQVFIFYFLMGDNRSVCGHKLKVKDELFSMWIDHKRIARSAPHFEVC